MHTTVKSTNLLNAHAKIICKPTYSASISRNLDLAEKPHDNYGKFYDLTNATTCIFMNASYYMLMMLSALEVLKNRQWPIMLTYSYNFELYDFEHCSKSIMLKNMLIISSIYVNKFLSTVVY